MEEAKIAELLTINEAAERMHVSRQTIYTWIHEGRVKPVLTPGGRTRIPEDQLIIKKWEPTGEVVTNGFPIRDISELDPNRIEQMGTKEEIERKLNKCLELLRKKDIYLLEANVNERTISHRLALYLQELFPDWHVDCEYNRYKKDPKRIDSLHEELSAGIQVNPLDDKARTVYPDVIIHNRGTDDNLVVIEVKKMSSTNEDDNFDLMKLRKYKKQLGYRYAIFLKLGVAENFSKKPDFHFI